MEHLTTETQAGVFKAPLTTTELHSHIVTVSVLLARQLHFVFLRGESNVHEQAQAMLLGTDGADGMNDPDVLPGHKGTDLTYEQ